MRLIKCYVASFGKLKNYSVELSGGLNTVKQDNGWGKTTLAFFIKAMFYGLRDSKKSVSENERVKFKPWNSTEKFGGYLEFEKNGAEFRIERFFGNKAADDTVRLTDVRTGKDYSRTEDLGRRIFEIDEDGFLSTTFFLQKDFEIKGNASLTAKYNSVCEADDSISFEKALERLEVKAKTYKYRGEKGLIYDARNQLLRVNEEIERASAEELTLKTLKGELKALEEERESLLKETDELSVKISKAVKAEAFLQKKKVYRQYLSEREQVLSEKSGIEKTLNGNVPTAEELSVFGECYRDYIDVSAKEKNLSASVAELDSIRKIAPDKKQSGNTLPIILSVIGGILLVAGIPLYFLSSTVGIILAASGCALGAGALVSRAVAPKKPKVGNDAGYDEVFNKKLAELEETAALKKELENRLTAYTGRYSMAELDFWQALDKLKEYSSEYNNLLGRLKNLERELSAIAEELNGVKNTENVGYNVEELRRQWNAKNALLVEKNNIFADKKARIVRYEEYVSCLPDLESKKKELEECGLRYKDEYELLTLTADYLKRADENLKTKYRAPLESSLNKYLSYITARPFDNARIDIDMKVTIEENGVLKSTDYYSEGYRNMFELCKRFALSDVLFTKEKPFMILDDPFTNLDDEKVREALSLVNKLSEDYQIIYLVCHESRRA